MHFCKARIAISGDQMNVYYANEYDPVSWPEVLVMQFVHGDESIDEVIPFVHVEQTPRNERQRLAEKYGEDVVSIVFGGKQGPAEMDAPSATLPEGVEWKSPISLQTELTPSKTSSQMPPPPPPHRPATGETIGRR